MASREEIDLSVLESYWGLGMSPDTQPHNQRWIQRGLEGHKAFPPSRSIEARRAGTLCADSQLCFC